MLISGPERKVYVLTKKARCCERILRHREQTASMDKAIVSAAGSMQAGVSLKMNLRSIVYVIT